MLAFLLLASRRQFDRRSALFSQALELGMDRVDRVGARSDCVLILFFAYREVQYDRELWWVFEFDANAPRGAARDDGRDARRAWASLVAAAASVAGHAGAAESRGSRPRRGDRQRATVRGREPRADRRQAPAVLDRRARRFVMFGRQGRSWISLFDPVGPRAEWPELIWRFIEEATDHGGRAIFYQVRPESLSLYLDAGLRASEARRVRLRAAAGVRSAGLEARGPALCA